VVQVQHLISTVKSHLQQYQGPNRELYLQPFAALEKAFNIWNFDAQWDAVVRQYLGFDVLLNLEHATNVLSEFYSSTGYTEPEIQKPDLDALLQEFHALFQQVYDAKREESIPHELGILLLDLLLQAKLAIQEYQIGGITRLHKFLDDALVKLARNRELFEESKDSSLVQKLWNFLGKFFELSKYAPIAMKLVESLPKIQETLKALPMLKDGSD